MLELHLDSTLFPIKWIALKNFYCLMWKCNGLIARATNSSGWLAYVNFELTLALLSSPFNMKYGVSCLCGCLVWYSSILFFFQCCYSLIDSLLEGTDLTGNITQAVDVILCPDVSFLQVQLKTSKLLVSTFALFFKTPVQVIAVVTLYSVTIGTISGN